MPQNDKMNRAIARRIKAARTKAGMTQEALAARLQLLGCDISRGTLAKIEVGIRSLFPDELKALRIALQVSYEDLLGEEGMP